MSPETHRTMDAMIKQQIKDTCAIRRANAGWRPWLTTTLVYALAFIAVKLLA